MNILVYTVNMSYFLVDAPKTEVVVHDDTYQQLFGWRKWAHQLNPVQIWKKTFPGENGVYNIFATTLKKVKLCFFLLKYNILLSDMDWGRWKDVLSLLVFGVILYASDYVSDILNFVEQKYVKQNHGWADCILFFMFTTHLIAASSDIKDAYYETFERMKEKAERDGEQPPSKVTVIKDVCLNMLRMLIVILPGTTALPFALCSTFLDTIFGMEWEFDIGFIWFKFRFIWQEWTEILDK